jgi:hypothetical protein
VRLVQALARLEVTKVPRLWLVTRGAQDVGPDADAIAKPSPAHRGLAQAPLWGMGRAIALEHPEFWGGLIDLDPESPADRAANPVEEIANPDGEDEVAYRRGGRFVARLSQRDGYELHPRPLPVRPEGTYLITGGLGDLGLRAAHWLAGRGARRIVLVGRRTLPRRASWDRGTSPMARSPRSRTSSAWA